MSQKAPGKSHRNGISLIEIMRKFPDDATAEAYFVEQRWPNGPACPHCGSTNVQSGTAHKTMPYRCREKECAKRFSAKSGTVMEGSKLGFQIWMIATFLLSTNLKSVSSMKLHRDLDITQKSAWFLAHRLRRALDRDGSQFSGPVEVDETYFGGKRRNMSNAKRKELAGTGRGAVGKVAVVGIKDRETKHVRAKVVEATDKSTLQGFVVEHTAPGAIVYTDEASSLRRTALRARERQAQRLGVRSGNGAHEWRRVLLVDAQARPHGHVPQDVAEAFGSLCRRVRGSSERPRIRHH